MRPRKRHTQTKNSQLGDFFRQMGQDHSDLLDLFKEMDKKDAELKKESENK